MNDLGIAKKGKKRKKRSQVKKPGKPATGTSGSSSSSGSSGSNLIRPFFNYDSGSSLRIEDLQRELRNQKTIQSTTNDNILLLEPALDGRHEVDFTDDKGRKVVVIPKESMTRGLSMIAKLDLDKKKKEQELQDVSASLDT